MLLSLNIVVKRKSIFRSQHFIISNHLSKEDTLYHLDWSTSFALAPFEEVIDVFGDQSFFAIHTPGHSSGHTSYLLNTKNGLILLTGDASHTRYGFENGIEPGWTADQTQAEESLKALKDFTAQYPDTYVVLGISNESSQMVLTLLHPKQQFVHHRYKEQGDNSCKQQTYHNGYSHRFPHQATAQV